MKNKDTISEIQDYLIRHQKIEDKIDDKKKYRVTRRIAESIKGIEDLPKGRCNACGFEDDKLFPVSLKICPTCANKIIKRGGNLPIIKKQIIDYHCDMCLVRTFTVFYVNPKICYKCSRRLGLVHKYGVSDMNNERKRIESDKVRRRIKWEEK